MSQLLILLSEEIKRDFKTKCALKKESMTKVILRLIRGYINE